MCTGHYSDSLRTGSTATATSASCASSGSAAATDPDPERPRVYVISDESRAMLERSGQLQLQQTPSSATFLDKEGETDSEKANSLPPSSVDGMEIVDDDKSESPDNDGLVLPMSDSDDSWNLVSSVKARPLPHRSLFVGNIEALDD